MAETFGGHVQEVEWSFIVQEVFHPRSTDGNTITVLAGNIRSGGQDEPIGRPVRLFVGGQLAGQGTVTSRFQFETSTAGQAAYVYEGSPVSRDDINKGVMLKTT